MSIICNTINIYNFILQIIVDIIAIIIFMYNYIDIARKKIYAVCRF